MKTERPENIIDPDVARTVAALLREMTIATEAQSAPEIARTQPIDSVDSGQYADVVDGPNMSW